MATFSKLICRFIAILKTPSFLQTDELTLKFTGESKGHQTAKKSLEKQNKVGELTLPNVET